MTDEKAETVTISEMPEERQKRLEIQERMLIGDSPTLFYRLAVRHWWFEMFGQETRSLVEVSDEN